jgi:hypothetical protein
MPSHTLKRASGWFAAGREVQQAALLLSDGAFKLFVWVCLHAERASGVLCASVADLAGTLRKTEADLTRYLEELTNAGVCRVLNPGRIEIRDCFWPYQRVRPESAATDPEAYVAAVRRMFLSQGCVRSSFTPADYLLAIDWNRRGIPLQNVERAILLGSIRKYAALVNRNGGTLITTLHYFSHLIEEVGEIEISSDYWNYMSCRIKDFEMHWRQM